MPGSGTRTFLDADHYEASLRQAEIDAIVTSGGEFKARLTWAELHYLLLLRCEEDRPRIAYLTLAPRLVYVAFPTRSSPLPVWGGTQLQPADIMFHSRGERLHQATLGPSTWSLIALDPVRFEEYARALSGKPLTAPPAEQVLRPSSRDAARLRRLHAQAVASPRRRPKCWRIQRSREPSNRVLSTRWLAV